MDCGMRCGPWAVRPRWRGRHELKRSGGRALNERFAAVLAHYGLRSTRIRPGQSQENGAVEQGHYRLKSAFAQALVMRGSRDFASVEAYTAFVQAVVAKLNRKVEAKLAESVSATAAGEARARDHPLHGARAQVERDPDLQQDLLGAVAPGGSLGGRPSARSTCSRSSILHAGRVLRPQPVSNQR